MPLQTVRVGAFPPYLITLNLDFKLYSVLKSPRRSEMKWTHQLDDVCTCATGLLMSFWPHYDHTVLPYGP